MKILFTCIFCCLFTALMAQHTNKPDPHIRIDTLDAACGMCQLGLKGEDCALAVRINGNAYYVDGTDIDKHGDAHAKDGFCNVIRKAEVQGKLINNRYQVTYFKLIPTKSK